MAHETMYVRVPVACRNLIINALRAANHHNEADIVQEHTRQYSVDAENKIRMQRVAEAKKELETDDLMIDEDAVISSGGNGHWVMAWV